MLIQLISWTAFQR